MRNIKSVLIFLVAAFVVVIGITVVANSYYKAPTVPDQTTYPPVVKASSYTLAQITTHSKASSCWTAIQGKVYDLTSWINQHPGGAEAILSLCGKDGTAAFEVQHGGQASPEQELASLYIGALIK